MKNGYLRNCLRLIGIIIFILILTSPLLAQKEGYKLYWHDEFDGTQLDTTKWHYRGLGPRRDGINVKEAVSLDGNGHLLITTTILDTSQYYVGAIGTDETFNTTYGYFECRAKFGKKVPWDSFWLQCPTAYEAGPPSTTGAEVDIFEFTRHYHTIVGWEIPHNIWWGDNNGSLVSWGSHASIIDNVDDFVTVGVEWISNYYFFYVNGVFTFYTDKGVSGVEEYIILSEEPRYWYDLPDTIQDGSALPLRDTFTVDYVRVYKKGLPSDMEDIDVEMPEKFLLSQNYPNPFNPLTSISYIISEDDNIVLTVYDARGRIINELVNGFKNKGQYSVAFDASGLPSGVYFYQLKVGSQYSRAKKMILVR